MIEYDQHWLAYTMSVWCANQYRVVDKSNPTYNVANQYVKYVKLFYRDKVTKRHYLPPATHKVVGGMDNFAGPELYHWWDWLREYQKNALLHIHNMKWKSCLIRSWEWTGKALKNDEPVLSEHWRKPIDSLKVWEKIYSKDWSLSNVIGVYPQWLRDIYKVTFIDWTYSLCDWDHLREVYTDHDVSWNKPNKIKTTLELMNDPYLRKKHGNRFKNKWYIPNNEPIQFCKKNLLIDPYLMWILLGDWHMNRVSITTADEQIKINVENIISNYNQKLTYNWKYWYTITNLSRLWKWHKNRPKNYVLEAIRKYWLEHKLSHDKFIPKDYLYSSIADRLELLRWLMDSDWYCDARWSASYTTCSHQLALDMQELIRSLWWVTQIRSRIPVCNWRKWKLSYTLWVRIKFNPFNLTRKSIRYDTKIKYSQPKSISSIVYYEKSEATCIKIDHPSELFITRDYIVTHNSRIIWWLSSMRDNMAIILVPTNMIQKQLQDEIPWARIMCLPTFKKIFAEINTWYPIILDECHRIWDALRDLLCTWKWKVIWLTASPFRLDFQTEGFKIFFWDLHETWAEALPIRVKPIKLSTEVDQHDFMRMSAEYSSESNERRRKWLVMNEWRAAWIASIAYKAMQKNNTVMVFSDRKEQVEAIHKECLKLCQDSYMMIWGKDNSKVKKLLDSKPQFIITATIQAVWEWMDIPNLMVWISCFSTANYKTIRQMAWRMRRFCWEKTHWYLIDIIDTLHIGKIKKQFSTRYDRKKIYLDLWFTVDDKDIMKHEIKAYNQDALF